MNIHRLKEGKKGGDQYTPRGQEKKETKIYTMIEIIEGEKEKDH